MTIKGLRVRQVFVPGGQPEYTYVNRHGDLEDEIRSAADNLCKLMTVTGMTKSGKYVLVNRVFPRSHAVWVDGGSVAVEEDFWCQVVDQLACATSTSASAEVASATTGTVDVTGELAIPAMAKVAGKTGAATTRSTRHLIVRANTSTSRATAIRTLRTDGRPLIIDDFHYLPEDVQGTLVRALKGLVFAGHPTLLLAIPHRRYDAIRVEREMTGRVHHVRVKNWSKDELRLIPEMGLPLLNATAGEAYIELFVAEALGSPHLAQELFLKLCLDGGLEQASPVPVTLKPPNIEHFLQTIAGDLSRPIFETLERGPWQRSARLRRQFRDAERVNGFETAGMRVL